MTATSPVRLRLSRRDGFSLQAHSLATNGLPAVNVARPGRLGNPFVVCEDGTRFECVGKYVMMLDGLFPVMFPNQEGLIKARRDAQRAIETLRGNNTSCWCALPKPGDPDVCHAAVLCYLANGADTKPQLDALIAHVFPTAIVSFRDRGGRA